MDCRCANMIHVQAHNESIYHLRLLPLPLSRLRLCVAFVIAGDARFTCEMPNTLSLCLFWCLTAPYDLLHSLANSDQRRVHIETLCLTHNTHTHTLTKSEKQSLTSLRLPLLSRSRFLLTSSLALCRPQITHSFALLDLLLAARLRSFASKRLSSLLCETLCAEFAPLPSPITSNQRE